MGDCRHAQSRGRARRRLVHLLAHLEKSIHGNHRLHRDGRARPGEIVALAGPKRASDPGSNAAPRLRDVAIALRTAGDLQGTAALASSLVTCHWSLLQPLLPW